MKSFNTVFLEAVFVGALLVVVYIAVDFVFKTLNYTDIQPFVLLFLSGAFFHIVCEYTGINIWYVREYNKILV
jgi:hypothetical protein